MNTQYLIAARGRVLRERVGLTQSELAGEIDVPTSTLSMFEQGRRRLTGSLKETLAAFYRVPLSLLTVDYTPQDAPDWWTASMEEDARGIAESLALRTKRERLERREVDALTKERRGEMFLVGKEAGRMLHRYEAEQFVNRYLSAPTLRRDLVRLILTDPQFPVDAIASCLEEHLSK